MEWNAAGDFRLLPPSGGRGTCAVPHQTTVEHREVRQRVSVLSRLRQSRHLCQRVLLEVQPVRERQALGVHQHADDCEGSSSHHQQRHFQLRYERRVRDERDYNGERNLLQRQLHFISADKHSVRLQQLWEASF